MAKVKVTESKLRGEITIHCNLLEDEQAMKLLKDKEPGAKIIPLQPAKENDEQV